MPKSKHNIPIRIETLKTAACERKRHWKQQLVWNCLPCLMLLHFRLKMF